MNQPAKLVPMIGTEAMADHIWQEYRELLTRHRAEPDRYNDEDRIKARAQAYARFEAAYNSYNTALDRRK